MPRSSQAPPPDLFSAPAERTLRLYDPADGGANGVPPSAEITLREAFERHHRRRIEVADGTLAAYANALGHWERLSGDPPISAIDEESLLDFREHLLAEGMAAGTCNKIYRQLRPILSTCGPARLRLIAQVPSLRLLRVRAPQPRVLTDAELGRLYAACSTAHIGQGPARRLNWPALWRAAIVLFVNVGPRNQELWPLAWEAVDWARRDIGFRSHKVHADLVRPLNATVIDHLAACRHEFTRIWPISDATMERAWLRIRAEAGVECTFHDLRRTCATRLEEFAPGAGSWMIGHRVRGVDAHYLNFDALTRRATDALPQPPAFGARPRETRQLTLF